MFKQNKKVQNNFRFKEREENFELTDVLEIIFLEMGKLDENKALEAMSVVERWLYFLKYVDDERRKERLGEILKENEGIHIAMEILKEVSADEELRTRIRFQEKAENDRKARLYYARLEGLLDILDDQTIALKTGLTIKQVTALRRENE